MDTCPVRQCQGLGAGDWLATAGTAPSGRTFAARHVPGIDRVAPRKPFGLAAGIARLVLSDRHAFCEECAPVGRVPYGAHVGCRHFGPFGFDRRERYQHLRLRLTQVGHQRSRHGRCTGAQHEMVARRLDGCTNRREPVEQLAHRAHRTTSSPGAMASVAPSGSSDTGGIGGIGGEGSAPAPIPSFSGTDWVGNFASASSAMVVVLVLVLDFNGLPADANADANIEPPPFASAPSAFASAFASAVKSLAGLDFGGDVDDADGADAKSPTQSVPEKRVVVIRTIRVPPWPLRTPLILMPILRRKAAVRRRRPFSALGPSGQVLDLTARSPAICPRAPRRSEAVPVHSVRVAIKARRAVAT